MAEEPGEWLTYRKAAERLGLQPAAIAARARRARWPKRMRNDTHEAEILVPAELLATPSQTPQEARPAPAPDTDAATVEGAVRAAAGPLLAALERQELAIKVLQAALDVARSQLAAGQTEVARSDTLRAAAEQAAADLAKRLEIETLDRRTLQGQADALRDQLPAARIDAAIAVGKVATEAARREAAEREAQDLRRQLDALQARPKRRWWWP